VTFVNIQFDDFTWPIDVDLTVAVSLSAHVVRL